MKTRRSAFRSCARLCRRRPARSSPTPVRTARSSSARSSRTASTFGYNAQTLEYGDLVPQGVIDPTKVVRCALQDAASVAGLLVTTEAMIAELPKKDTGQAHSPMGGGSAWTSKAISRAN